MNRLPKVLQAEIWEYVHGDRAFFKQQFRIVMLELRFNSPEHHLIMAQRLKHHLRVMRIPVIFGGNWTCGQRWVVWLSRHRKSWVVNVYDYITSGDPPRPSIAKTYQSFKEARAAYREQVIIAATKTREFLDTLLINQNR
jgi:hypothetical protein